MNDSLHSTSSQLGEAATAAASEGRPLRLMVLAGETSGDLHAAALLKELRRICPVPVEAYGIGGNQLMAEGMEVLEHSDNTGILGIVEVLRHLGFFLRLLRRMRRLLVERRPDVLLTVDFVDFNLRIAACAKRLGIRTVHLVCPQVWAWRRGRIPKIARIFDRLLVFFPFEPRLFEGTGLRVDFVGHPLVDRAEETRQSPPAPLPWGAGRRIALFPGSRRYEVRPFLATILAAARSLEAEAGECSFLIPAPTERVAGIVREALGKISDRPRQVEVVVGNSRHALLQSEAAVVKSGTSTLEASLMLCPMVIVYKVSGLTAFVYRMLISKSIRFVGLPNLLAGREVCRELLQGDFTEANLSKELRRIVLDPAAREAMLADLRAVNASLGGTGTAARAAASMLDVARLAAPALFASDAARH